MQITAALGNALYGIQKGLTEIDKNAAKIASADTLNSPDAVDVAQPLVALQANKLQVEAAAKLMKNVDETLGSLIDLTV